VGTYAAESEGQENGGTQMALILFVEHHNAFRQAASYVMDQEPDLEVVAQGGSVAEGRRRMVEGGIDMAIVDIPLPDEGAPEMVRDLQEANPPIPVLVMTHIEDPAIHEQMLRAGAAEVLPKGVSFGEILAALRRFAHQH
jgi:DNA-binding NarL/FixJ family response regulator